MSIRAGAGVLVLTASMLLAGVTVSTRAAAAPLDLAAMSCTRYENEIVAPTGPGPAADPIDTMMGLFGFAVARSGERAMFGDSLPAFGFALDAECKNFPNKPLLDALVEVKSKRDHPMDLTGLSCTTFITRHQALRKSDAESANTLAMWLYGYAVGLTEGHVLDAASLNTFEAGIETHCAARPTDTLFDALRAPNLAVPGAFKRKP